MAEHDRERPIAQDEEQGEQPVADAMAAEFSRKLGTPVTLGFEHLWRADTVLTMARAAAQLTASGVSIKDALDAVGLGED